VATDYAKFSNALQSKVKQTIKEGGADVYINCYMIGRSKEKARPFIVIASDERARKEAEAAIKKSCILTPYPHFKIWLVRYLPTGPITVVAIEDQPPPQPFPSELAADVYFDPTEQIRAVGMSIYIKHSKTAIRRATANAIYNGAKYRYITTAHAFNLERPNRKSSMDSLENFNMPFDSSSENESKDNDEAKILTEHSRTSLETRSLNSSSLTSSQISIQRSGTPQLNHMPSMASIDYLNLQVNPEAFSTDEQTNEHVDAVPHVTISRLESLGMCSSMSGTHDYAVICVTSNAVLAVLRKFRGTERATKDTTVIATPKPANVTR
jgi:hypothetical protein